MQLKRGNRSLFILLLHKLAGGIHTCALQELVTSHSYLSFEMYWISNLTSVLKNLSSPFPILLAIGY